MSASPGVDCHAGRSAGSTIIKPMVIAVVSNPLAVAVSSFNPLIPRSEAIQRNAQRGVGLIEVLVSLLVLSLGMLGLAGLQLWSLKNNQGSMARSLAVVQAHSIIDAMRAERATATTGGFDIAFGPNAEVPTVSPFAHAALTTWLTNLETVLGSGATGSVSCDGGHCTVRIRWSDQRSAAVSSTEREGTPPQEVVTEVQL